MHPDVHPSRYADRDTAKQINSRQIAEQPDVLPDVQPGQPDEQMYEEMYRQMYNQAGRSNRCTGSRWARMQNKQMSNRVVRRQDAEVTDQATGQADGCTRRQDAQLGDQTLDWTNVQATCQATELPDRRPDVHTTMGLTQLRAFVPGAANPQRYKNMHLHCIFPRIFYTLMHPTSVVGRQSRSDL
jgi:hypothetical protein